MALLQEILPADQAYVREMFQKTAWVMWLSDSHRLKLLRFVIAQLGVDAVSRAVHSLKQIKRRLRARKVTAFEVTKRGGR